MPVGLTGTGRGKSIEVSCEVLIGMISSAAMVLVGLTGGVASGKTTVANLFRECGAVLIDADRLAREAVEPGKPAWRDTVHAFGKSILHTDHTINRTALANIIFRHPGKRRLLEHIIHPRVARRQIALARQAARKNQRAVIIYEVPLLFEAGVDRRVDYIVVVAADRKTQITRLKKRNGLSQAEALRRITSQLPMASKKARADTVLDGTASRPILRSQVRQLFRHLRQLA